MLRERLLFRVFFFFWGGGGGGGGGGCVFGVTYLTVVKGAGIVLSHEFGMGVSQEKACLGCISETMRCRKFILGRDIIWGCKGVTPWCDLDLTFDLAIVNLSMEN